LRNRFTTRLRDRAGCCKTRARRDSLTDTARHTGRLGDDRRAVNRNGFATSLRDGSTGRRALLRC
jgi:hypothetical protein